MNETLNPQDEAQLAEMIAQAYADKTSLRITGGGTRLSLGGLVNAQKPLSLTALNGVTLYDAGALTLVAKSGTPYAEIEAMLAAEGQRLAFEPMDHRAIFGTSGVPTIGAPTIGAIAACNISGSRRIQAGACRDALIGVRFVNGCGEIIKNGGRVMKNVTGLDLVKLMAGSFGTLGVLSEVAFKTLPSPERQATLCIHDHNVSQAVRCLSIGLTSPFEVTGAAYIAAQQQSLLRVEGFDSQVTYRLKKLTALIGTEHEITIIEGDENAALWQNIRNVEAFGQNQQPLWRLSVKASDAPQIVTILTEQTQAEILLDWGGGLIWAQLPEVNNSHAQTIRNTIAKFGGHATLVRASDGIKAQTPVFQPQATGVAKLSERLRQKFDPANILNPNLMSILNPNPMSGEL